ncbi:hypothetical protein HPP92_003852 [Vanilla planifolia]|uniref:Heptahelical transmembrane protein ADIPOR1 n=1 Tax=Vanilla planifolia TaxID=51239 RepID=A0A835RVN9_VANPL|nr:hypothetical protein HPP92_003852 [Vanilla planifolia]
MVDARDGTVESEELMAKYEKQGGEVAREKKEKKGGNKKRKKKRKDRQGEDGGIGEYRLVGYEELPSYMKENEFIRRYYRSQWPISHAFLSLFSWHNETINVWTHLLGFLLFLGLTVKHLMDMPQVADLLGHLSWSISAKEAENASLNQGSFFSMALPLVTLDRFAANSGDAPLDTAPRWPFLVFLAGSMLCLLTSSLCHLLCCHSRRLNFLLVRLDYAGIAVMIAASFFPPISYAFLCAPRWGVLYLSAISALAVLAVLSLLAPEATPGSRRAFRAMVFCALGLSGIVPAVHIAAVNWAEARRAKTMAWEAAMGLSYLVGTGFYVSRVPERWRPGKFDVAGHSHQIFHVFVLAGAAAHYVAALLFMEWRDKVGCWANTEHIGG